MLGLVRRLLVYVAGLLGALALVEGAFRIFEPEIVASAHRATTKAALLRKQGPVDVLFFGTSRFWDAIAPSQFAACLPGARAFSLATSGARLDTLQSMAEQFAGRPGLRLAFVELSRPHLDTGSPPEAPATAIEALAARTLKLVEHRAALRGESLARLPSLLFFPRVMDGSEVRLADEVAALLGRSAIPPTAMEARPAPVGPSTLPPGSAAQRMGAVGRRIREAGAQVVFVLPPIQSCEPPEDVEAVAGWLAREFPVWDYRAVSLPHAAWRDCAHLNPAGRGLFTCVLAADTKRFALLQPVAGRSD
jgi:hypothetical protein